jgi:hypothetical protein
MPGDIINVALLLPTLLVQGIREYYRLNIYTDDQSDQI